MRELPDLVRVFAALAALAVCACGDDDADDGRGGDQRDAATRDAGPGFGREGDEGWLCLDADECNAELVCAASPITASGVPIGVCGRPCDPDEDCADGVCFSYTGRAEDAHCTEVIEEEFALCGVADNSICADETICLYLPGAPVGVCVRLCATGSASPGEEDAGVSEPALGECSAGQTCVEGVVTSGEGVCGTEVERGAECGIELGLFCESGHICAPEDPRDSASTFRCFQDCSEPDTVCDEGSCVLVQRLYAYCI